MAAKKAKKITKQDIIEKYTDYCLVNGSQPATVYKFAKDNSFEEAEFYKFFASFDVLEQEFFNEMYSYTIEMLEKSPAYTDYEGTQKLSAFYFTFFELATANRSFVMYLIGNGKSRLQNLLKLRGLRKSFIAYANEVLEKPIEIKAKDAEKLQEKALQEGAWLQFLSIFKFWLDDTSPSFEKTDVFIEKSVKASSDLIYNTPLNSLLDLGKFIWKERFTTA